MQNNRQFLVIGAIILVIVGLIWLRGRNAGLQIEVPDEDTQLEEQVNRFLEDRGITLPEGADRANLRDRTDSGYTGISTRQIQDNSTTYTIIASLDDLDMGWYEAWIVNNDDDFISLGRLRTSKGGFLLDYSTSIDTEGYNKVQISQESSVASRPSDIILEGEF